MPVKKTTQREASSAKMVTVPTAVRLVQRRWEIGRKLKHIRDTKPEEYRSEFRREQEQEGVTYDLLLLL